MKTPLALRYARRMVRVIADFGQLDELRALVNRSCPSLGYGDRTSVESRFAMCAFTDMALQRKFAAWVVSEVGEDKVLVGFPTPKNEDVAAALGPRFAGPDLLKASVRAVNRMCSITVK